MSKGGYNGGSTLVGFGGAFSGAQKKKLAHATNVDAHHNKQARNLARSAADRMLPKIKVATKLTKSERKAEALARKKFRETQADVVVEHRVKGIVATRRTITQT
ncbi:hypothetical protein [Sphingomonas sp. RB1R13]|uniref:hypothetical protein n=1 Tax=Sphingomonas sp. RB1R13 TaxID=3096159 RepID=UPI002FCBFD01